MLDRRSFIIGGTLIPLGSCSNINENIYNFAYLEYRLLPGDQREELKKRIVKSTIDFIAAAEKDLGRPLSEKERADIWWEAYQSLLGL